MHLHSIFQVSLEGMSRDNSKLKAEVQSLTPVREECDLLKQQAASLESDNTKLRGELDAVNKSNSSALQANDEALRTEMERKSAEEVKRVREEMSAQHRSEVEGLRETIARLENSHGAKEKEVEDLRAQVDKSSSLEEQLKAVSEQLRQEQGSKKVRRQSLVNLLSH